MSTKPHNIFISWSGPRSKHVATALNEWLPTILQSARPWYSRLSIEKGARPLEEIAAALETIQIGICCLTPENLASEWILYEAGALSKSIGTKSRLCTFLLGGLTPEGVPPPLGMFQHSRSDKEDTLQMLKSINKSISEDPVPEPALEKLFEKMWPELEQSIKTMPSPEKDVPAERSEREMIAEILDFVRSTRPEPPQFEIWSIPQEGNLSGVRIHLKNPPNMFVCSKCGSTAGVAPVDEGIRCVTCGAINSSMLMIPQPPIESKAE